jgi:hypothetical protein
MSPASIEEVKKEIDSMNQTAGSADDFMWGAVKLLHDLYLAT